MSWIRHPKYRHLIEVLSGELRAQEYRFRKVNPVLFICGGACSTRREALAEYTRKNFPDYLLFYAEDVWPAIAAKPGSNALGMEAQLAEISDIVIIIVESAGTIAELGAFALSEPLRKKLLPIVDRGYQKDSSFINTGPLRWIEQDSNFSPIIWVSLDSILKAAADVDERLNRLHPEKKIRVSNLTESPKHLLFFICDLISIIGPCDIEMVGYFVAEVLQTESRVDVNSLISLAKAMTLVNEIQFNGCGYYFSNLDRQGRLRSYHRNKFIDIPRMRMDAMSVIQSIEEARQVLAVIGDV